MQVNPAALHDSVDSMFKTIEPDPIYIQGRSIVTSIYHKELATGYVLLNELSRLKVKIPVEVFYRNNELTDTDIEILSNVDLNLQIKQIKGNAKDFTTQYGTIAGWSTKVYALLESEYQHNLWIDSDNFPINNPEFLFDDQDYINKGSLFWRDMMSPDRANRYHDDAVIWPIFKVIPNDAEPFESGQLLIDKVKCLQQMRLVKHYADHCEIYYNFGGDSETFRMAWQHYHLRNGNTFPRINYHQNNSMASPYGFMPYGCFNKGGVNKFGKWGGGTIMVQRDRNGNELFNHRNIDKMSINNNVFNTDILNEKYYHAHISNLYNILTIKNYGLAIKDILK